MTKTLQIGSMVRIGHLFLIVEDIDGAFFFGSDDSGDSREYAVKDIDKVIE